MSDVGSERLISADRENDLGYPADSMRVYLSICKVGVLQLKAKFHYASWFEAGSEPASVMEFGFKRVNGSSCFFGMIRSRKGNLTGEARMLDLKNVWLLTYGSKYRSSFSSTVSHPSSC